MSEPDPSSSQSGQPTSLTPLEHVLQIVLKQPAGSPLHQALDHNGYGEPADFMTETDKDIDELKYPKDKKLVVIAKGHAGMLKSFKNYVAYLAQQGTPVIDFTCVTKEDFDLFRTSKSFAPLPTVAVTANQPQTVRPPFVIDLVKEFKRGIKRDALQFSLLKDDAAWDNWNRSTVAQARAQDIAEVLDPTYAPVAIEDIQLFEEKQKFMYAVFERTLLTDKGKALVRHHQLSFDAQTIYKELTMYAMQPTKATMNALTILSYITTTNLGDGKWKGSTHGFVLHWQDQVRKYQDLNPQPPLAPEFLCTLLQNAVHPIAELRQIKVQLAQLKAFTGRDLSYDQYCTLLLSAAQQYDQQNAVRGDKVVKRRICQHNIY